MVAGARNHMRQNLVGLPARARGDTLRGDHRNSGVFQGEGCETSTNGARDSRGGRGPWAGTVEGGPTRRAWRRCTAPWILARFGRAREMKATQEGARCEAVKHTWRPRLPSGDTRVADAGDVAPEGAERLEP